MITTLNLRVTILATTLFLTGFSHSISGQTTNKYDVNKKSVPFKITPKSSTSRPRMPSHQQLYGEYCDGFLTVSFKIPEGNCVLTYSNSAIGIETSVEFDSSKEAKFFVGYGDAPIHITVTTSFGNEYEAVIDLSNNN